MIDRQASSQTTQLTELQTELKSLKSLIVARRPAGSPSAPAINPPASPLAEPASTSAPNGTSPFPARPFGGRAPGIPAWQRAAQPTTSASASASATPSPSLAASEVKDDPSGSGVLVGRPEGGLNGAEKEGEAGKEVSSGSEREKVNEEE